MRITKKVIKEVEVTDKYVCDVCGKIIPVNGINREMNLNIIKYSTSSPSWGGEENKEKHVCSRKCLLKALKGLQYDTSNCDIHLADNLMDEIFENDKED